MFLAHKSHSRVPFEDDLETSDSFGVELVVEQHLGFIISVDVLFAETDRVVKIDG